MSAKPLKSDLQDVHGRNGVRRNQVFLQPRYPAGRFAAQANARLAQLRGAPGTTTNTTPANPNATSPVALATPPTGVSGGDQAQIDRRTQELLASLSSPKPSVASQAAVPIKPVAKSNTFGYTVGDRWRYQLVDKFKGEVVSNYALQVDGIAANGDVSLNKGSSVWDATGSYKLIKNAERTRDFKNQILYPKSFQAGNKTDLNYEIDHKFTDGRAWKETVKGAMTVRGQERVKTPAGEFDAWRVDLDVFWQQSQGANGGGRFISTSWYVPELRRYVAWEEESRNTNGTVNRRERHELTSYEVAPALLAQR